MTTFSDKELNELKELLDNPQASGFFTEDMARRILHRLEASDKACESSSKVIVQGAEGQHSRDCAAMDLLAWREACGK